MDNLDFSEEEIQEQLAILGYNNIPKHRLLEFKQDLDDLIRHGEWRSLAPSTRLNHKTVTTTSQPSPPVFTKEKVGRCYIEDTSEGFFLHANRADHDREDRGYGRQQGRCDSYAQHSVAPKLQLPPGAPRRLQVEPDVSPLSRLSDSYTSSSDAQEKRFIKRKVLRKHEGQSLVCDESIYSEDSDATSYLEERLAELRVSTSAQRDSSSENEDRTDLSDTRSSEADGDGISLSALESYIRAMTQTQSEGDLRPKPKSFIRPVMSQQTMKKTDPVAKYFQYKQLWEMFKLPGEKDRRSLRWEIKERLAYQPPPPKPRRVYVPNTYVVPTEKKRSALRWEIRNDLANGLLPHKLSYRF
ncbi:hydrolethalus syndrome protein 1 homolog isoform X4 [Mugil cephalus]|nr:hydrolethalus syndrome protein 1 homolog isoform X4 [Mugil cephalus]